MFDALFNFLFRGTQRNTETWEKKEYDGVQYHILPYPASNITNVAVLIKSHSGIEKGVFTTFTLIL